MTLSADVRSALLALLASAVLSFIDNFVALVAEEAGVWQFQVFRALMAIPILVLIGRVFGQSLRPKKFKNLAMRSVTVAIGLLMYFASLGVLPVAQAGAGLFSAPIWVLLFSAVLFGVRITALQFSLIGAGFTGVLLLLQPDLATLTALSVLPLVAGAFYGLGMLLTPQLCGDESPALLAIGVFASIGCISLVMLIYFSMMPVESPTFLTAGWTVPTSRFMGLTLFQAIGAVVAVMAIAQAYRIGQSAFVAVVEYSFLIFACIWSFLLWNTTTNLVGLLGIGIIVVSGCLLVFAQSGKAKDTATS
ncbi:DMT family transporter [Cognatishimia sp. 1_MG-2023]|uniref:DMT family transporter n=1 Tax=Cognatishimia sp. 1_MG-2023 TaxID=3062642 RepID=UPI0026E3C35D|nr:DMT family transporter [Cognatishimia sp. 1_MG-2023]MDO6728200.1 DMT family transporter [Cognatishimia sp. 1_MG-2023]